MTNKKLIIIMAVGLVVGMGLGVSGTLLVHRQSIAADGCSAPAHHQLESHNVMIMDSKVSPSIVTGKMCDTITIMNMDDIEREIAFGPHEAHVPYDGVAEKVLKKGQSFTVTLNQAGSFRFHDHLHDEVEGFFTVTK